MTLPNSPWTTEMPRALSRVAAVVAALALATGGCAIVDETLIDELPSREGDDDDDVTPVNDCGDPDAPFIPRRAASEYDIDTRELTDEASVECGDGGGSSGGNDAFLALQVEAFDYWHFHLTPRRTTADRNPVLYLVRPIDGVCDERQCGAFSDRCVRFGEEHFGFRPNEAGLWYLGIDDFSVDGGEYRLSVFKPECGNGIREHGEGCDGEDPPCDAACRRLLTGPIIDETDGLVPPNTPDEALAIMMGADESVLIRGNADNDQDAVAGDECQYPDYYAISVPANGSVDLHLERDGNACAGPADVVPVRFSLLRRTLGEQAASEPDPATTCPVLSASGLPEGQYFIAVEQTMELETVQLAYDLRLTVTGP